MNYLRGDLVGPRHLCNFMLNAGPKVEECVTSVTFVHAEVIRSAVRPALMESAMYPIDMVMVPDGDSQSIDIIEKFLYGDGDCDRDSALVIPTAQAAIVGNALSNLLGVSTSEILQEIVIESPNLSTPTQTLTLGSGSPPFSPYPSPTVSALRDIAIGSPIAISSRPPAVAVMLLQEGGMVEQLKGGRTMGLLQEGGTVGLLQKGGTVDLLQEGETVGLLQEGGTVDLLQEGRTVDLSRRETPWRWQ